MIEPLLGALAGIVTGTSALYLVGGVLLGLVVGVLPGFGGTVGLSLLLPFVYGLEPAAGIALMVGMMSVVATADTFPAVLIGVPGSVSSQATVLDGFPLAKRGEAARALSAAFVASLFGGIFGAVILSVMVQLARPIVLAFGTGEMLMLGIFGLTIVGMITGASALKGIVAACAGLILGMIGIAPGTSEYRMEFEILYLSNGIPLMVLAISIFAVPEIVDLLRRGGSIAESTPLGSGWRRGVADAWRHKGLALRCSGIGALIGMLPGLGGSVIDWIAYGHAVQTERRDPRFGDGDVRGVIAPESANNAKEGGALVPTLIFGIPGSAATAILLGGLILVGVEPGVQMLTTDLEIVYTIIWSLALANVVGTILCVILSVPIARLTAIDFRILAPFILVLILFAAFNASRSWGDLIMAVGLGIVAVYMRRFGYPRPALMIGFVLSTGVETNFYQTLQFYSLGDLVARPVFLVLVAVAAGSVWMGMRVNRQREAHTAPGAHRPSLGQWVFLAGAAIVVALPPLLTAGLMFNARIFPAAVSASALAAIVALAWHMARGGAESPVFLDLDRSAASRALAPLSAQLGWIVMPLAMAAVVGWFLASGLFVFLFLARRSTLSLGAAAAGGGLVLVALALLGRLLRLDFPTGLLQDIATLPWPLA
ncbi:MAG: tripartite tricarboxylate transporter permease [Pseudomonadota bacterium]